jgi:cytochrome b561
MKLPTGSTMSSPSSNRYPRSIIALHWLTFLLVVLAYVCMEFRDVFERGSAGREFMKSAHYSVGLTILGLTLTRLVMRFTSGPAPAITPPPAAFMALASKVFHLVLYAFLIAMPFIGWATLSTEGDPVIFFGLELPPLIGRDKVLSGRLEEWHETLAFAGYFLIGGHALAAIIHHALIKDNTLARIMPGRQGRHA